jgi:hypothetical protein
MSCQAIIDANAAMRPRKQLNRNFFGGCSSLLAIGSSNLPKIEQLASLLSAKFNCPAYTLCRLTRQQWKPAGVFGLVRLAAKQRPIFLVTHSKAAIPLT